jgi:hypothetical protein
MHLDAQWLSCPSNSHGKAVFAYATVKCGLSKTAQLLPF